MKHKKSSRPPMQQSSHPAHNMPAPQFDGASPTSMPIPPSLTNEGQNAEIDSEMGYT